MPIEGHTTQIPRAVWGAQGHGSTRACGGGTKEHRAPRVQVRGMARCGGLGSQGLATGLVGAHDLGQTGLYTAGLSGVKRGGSAGLAP